jgi:metal-responsive CopG/Arc/MetJ family transcriptional regulator
MWYQNMENMKTLSLKLDDDIFSETEKVISRMKKSRNRYIMKLWNTIIISKKGNF